MTCDTAEEDRGKQRVACRLDPLPTPRTWARTTDSRVTNRVTHMKLRGTGWFLTIAAIPAMVVLFLAPTRARADYTYEYSDDFSTDKALTDSYIHSTFWPQGAYPPSEAYLYRQDSGPQMQLGFRQHNDEPAYLGYRFPTGRAQPGRAVFGSLQITVRLPYGSEAASPSSYLGYRLSADGINWSSPQTLDPGSHDILMESVTGACYAIFFGTDVLIDNLSVRLSALPATIRVPQDASTIQAAIDAATDGDIVEVARGTYAGDRNRDIDFRGKAITVRSVEGPEVTTIDCGGRRGVYFHSRERPDSVLRRMRWRGVAPGSPMASYARNLRSGTTGNGICLASRYVSTSRWLFPAPIPKNFTRPARLRSFFTRLKTSFITGAWSPQEKQWVFRNSTYRRSALTSFKENVSAWSSPKNFCGRPRYSILARVKVMGKAKSGKKSPGVMTRPFSAAATGKVGPKPATRVHTMNKQIHRIFIPSVLLPYRSSGKASCVDAGLLSRRLLPNLLKFDSARQDFSAT